MSFWSRGSATAVVEARAAIRGPSVDSDPRRPAIVGARSAADYRCDADTLLAGLERLVALRRHDGAGDVATTTAGFAVFFIELRRSDRTQALAGLQSARAAIDSVCNRISDILHPGDRFALNGVDEVLLLLPEVDSVGRALLVASRLVNSLQEPSHTLPVVGRVRPSIGCALFPAHGDDAEALIGAAACACRDARALDEGYLIAMRGEAGSAVATLSYDLETALNSNQLQVWLQPQLDLRNGRYEAAEALIRWPRDAGLPTVSPVEMVELAETHGWMPELTRFVLNTVLRQSALLAQRGIAIRIAVNLSASMLGNVNLPRTVQEALELWDVPPERLTLEVTENTLMHDVERSIGILHQLKRIGTHLSLDDFGTGYSSFAYLRRMPLDELKIDQLFVRNVSVLADGSINPQRDDDLRIVRSIIDIAHNFDLQTVAEGVEDAATLDVLKDMGCDVIQGYFTGRPMPIPAAEAWWRERQA